MGKYCSNDAVMTRLAGKVKFDVPGGQDPNKMSLQLLTILVSEAESQLEIDLMDRYEIPFQTICGSPFEKLPQNTFITLKNLAELISVIRVLETDFGRGTSVNGEKYTQACQKRYDSVIGRLMAYQEQTAKTSRQWRIRPLDGLMVSYNNQADNGFRGRVTNSSNRRGAAEYAEEQINRPEATIWNGIGDGHRWD